MSCVLVEVKEMDKIMKSSLNKNLGCIVILVIVGLSCSFHMLIDPNKMLETCDVIFDQYNTSGIIG